MNSSTKVGRKCEKKYEIAKYQWSIFSYGLIDRHLFYFRFTECSFCNQNCWNERENRKNFESFLLYLCEIGSHWKYSARFAYHFEQFFYASIGRWIVLFNISINVKYFIPFDRCHMIGFCKLKARRFHFNTICNLRFTIETVVLPSACKEFFFGNVWQPLYPSIWTIKFGKYGRMKIFFFVSRFPFNWKTPFGYLVATIFSTASNYVSFSCTIPTMCLAVGTGLLDILNTRVD